MLHKSHLERKRTSANIWKETRATFCGAIFMQSHRALWLCSWEKAGIYLLLFKNLQELLAIYTDAGSKRFTLTKRWFLTSKKIYLMNYNVSRLLSLLIAHLERILDFFRRKNTQMHKMKRIDSNKCKEKMLVWERIINEQISLCFVFLFDLF